MILSPSAHALSFTLELPELIGTWGDRLDPDPHLNLPASFDFGREFQFIESVALEIDATVFAHEFDYCGSIFDPQPCIPAVDQWGFFSYLNDEGASGFIFAGIPIGDPYAPVVTGTGRGDYDRAVLHSTFAFLFDGKGSLTLHWNEILYLDGIVITHLNPSTEITGARLILEGIPVPEPATFGLVTGGLALLAAARRRGEKHGPRSR